MTNCSHISRKQRGVRSEVSIVVAGDLCPGDESESLLCAGHPEKLFSDLMPYLFDNELSVVNLECPLTHCQTPIVKSGPHMRSVPACAEGIRSGGFDVVTLANNHIMDMGERGLVDTLSACRAVGLMTVGAGRDLEEATQPLIVAIGGLKIAILAFTEHEFSIATSSKAGAWPLDPVDNHQQIKAAQQQANYVLVTYHGGNEYHPLPSPRVSKTSRQLVDWGANAVICHHTHVASGMEIYRGAPIVYGTGNFLFDKAGSHPDGWYTGYLVNLKIRANTTSDIQLIPYRQCIDHPGIYKMGTPEADNFLCEINKLSEVIADESALASAWEQFCGARRVQYLSRILALSRIERRLLRWGIWPFWRCRRIQVKELLNLVSCESHRDVLISVMLSELKELGRQ